MNSTINRYDPQTASPQKDNRSAWIPTHIALWFCAIVFYGLGDLLTTAAVLAAGGHELNPVLVTAATVGGGLWGPIVVKMATIIALAAIYLSGCLKNRWAIPALLTVAGLGLMVNNVIANASL